MGSRSLHGNTCVSGLSHTGCSKRKQLQPLCSKYTLLKAQGPQVSVCCSSLQSWSWELGSGRQVPRATETGRTCKKKGCSDSLCLRTATSCFPFINHDFSGPHRLRAHVESRSPSSRALNRDSVGIQGDLEHGAGPINNLSCRLITSTGNH